SGASPPARCPWGTTRSPRASVRTGTRPASSKTTPPAPGTCAAGHIGPMLSPCCTRLVTRPGSAAGDGAAVAQEGEDPLGQAVGEPVLVRGVGEARALMRVVHEADLDEDRGDARGPQHVVEGRPHAAVLRAGGA